jgi:hypothetical protein
MKCKISKSIHVRLIGSRWGMRLIPSRGVALVIWLEVYVTSWVILLVAFYVNERARVGPIAPRKVRVMSEMAAVFALVPATVYVLFAELAKRSR